MLADMHEESKGLGMMKSAVRDAINQAILCSIPNWRSLSHYIFIREINNLFHCAHLFIVQECIMQIFTRMQAVRATYIYADTRGVIFGCGY